VHARKSPPLFGHAVETPFINVKGGRVELSAKRRLHNRDAAGTPLSIVVVVVVVARRTSVRF